MAPQVKNLPGGLISGLRKSLGGGNGNPLQYFCLKNPMDRGAWWGAVQFSSIAQLCPTLRDLMNCSTPGLHVHHQLLEFTQTHVHWVSDAIQPSHPLSSPSSPTFSLSQHQGLFKWINYASAGQSIGVSASTSVLPMNIQDWFPLGWTGWISLQSKGPSRVFSNTTVQKHQFFSAQLSSHSNSHIRTWLPEKP